VYVVALAPVVASGVADSAPALVPRYTLYPLTAAPPLLSGAVHESLTCAFPPIAESDAGADGSIAVTLGGVVPPTAPVAASNAYTLPSREPTWTTPPTTAGEE